MFAIAFDLVVAETEKCHPKGGSTLYGFGFNRVQGSLYVSDNEDMANLFKAIIALKALKWFPPSVRDIRAFRVEQWSDFTALIKEQ
ncbi:MAG: virulence factor [Gammaproteobacteria bacterium]|nr:virulence factor [Gammaproteobacteria bacterium]